jgi:hypothetical protein
MSQDLSNASTIALEVEEEFTEFGVTLGENGRPAFLSTDSSLVDLFFSVVPGTTLEDLRAHLDSSWASDPENTLRLIFNFGNCRQGEGGKKVSQIFLMIEAAQKYMQNISLT